MHMCEREYDDVVWKSKLISLKDAGKYYIKEEILCEEKLEHELVMVAAVHMYSTECSVWCALLVQYSAFSCCIIPMSLYNLSWGMCAYVW